MLRRFLIELTVRTGNNLYAISELGSAGGTESWWQKRNTLSTVIFLEVGNVKFPFSYVFLLWFKGTLLTVNYFS